MMPLAWLKPYQVDGGQPGQCFTTTAGAATDFRSPDLRRLIVNATFHLTDLEVPGRAGVKFVDPFHPSVYGFMPKDYFVGRGLKPADFALGKSERSLPDPVEAAAAVLAGE